MTRRLPGHHGVVAPPRSEETGCSLPIVLSLLALTACHPHRADETGDTAGSPDAPGHLGGLQLLEIAREDADAAMVSLWMWGLYDRPAPDARWYGDWGWMAEVLAEYGECVLVDTFPIHTCTPACDPEAFCSAEGCVDWPENRTAGAIEVTGLTQDLHLVPTDLGWYTSEDDLPDDLYDPGSTVVMEAEGGQIPAFSARAVAPPDLGPTLDCAAPPQAGQDFALAWTPAAGSFRVRLEIIAVYHAGNGPMLICDVDDAAGALVVPAAVVDAWLPYRTPAETFQVTRYSRGEGGVGGGRSVVLDVGAQRACW